MCARLQGGCGACEDVCVAMTSCVIICTFLYAQNTGCEIEWTSEAEDEEFGASSNTTFSGMVGILQITIHFLLV